jgi:purine-binding chemotaxis protein CheW
MNELAGDGILIFSLDDEHYAISVKQIRSISDSLQVAWLPKSPAWLAGITYFQSEIIPVINLRAIWKKSDSSRPMQNRYIIVEGDESVSALQVDKLCEISKISDWEAKSDLIGQVAQASYNQKPLFLIDVRKLISSLSLL